MTPTQPVLTIDKITDTFISLAWVSSDNVGVTSYALYKDGVKLKTINSNGYIDLNVAPDTKYTYYVVAFDASGNFSSNSNSLELFTDKDEQLPTVTAITTKLSEKNVIIGVSASDNRSVTAVALEYSYDNSNWTSAKTVNASGSTSVRVSASIDISDFTDGKLFFRAIAIDSAENKSVLDSTQIAEVIVDNTSPDKPAKIITDNDGYTVGFILGQPVDADFSYYRIYRSTNGTNYNLLRDNYRYADLYDNTTEPGET
jgi:chitodextrinase